MTCVLPSKHAMSRERCLSTLQILQRVLAKILKLVAAVNIEHVFPRFLTNSPVLIESKISICEQGVKSCLRIAQMLARERRLQKRRTRQPKPLLSKKTQ
ncbi:hypothetical protein F4861DRAFT_117537 [Xylaria intraflava]|nr:hypothetical protein F4861DRAFT_117537 [Xylaria intraflava]